MIPFEISSVRSFLHSIPKGFGGDCEEVVTITKSLCHIKVTSSCRGRELCEIDLSSTHWTWTAPCDLGPGLGFWRLSFESKCFARQHHYAGPMGGDYPS